LIELRPWTTLAFFNDMADFAGVRFLIFRVGELTCGAEVTSVREILPALTTTRIPGAPEMVSGVVNVRGTLVTVADGRRTLGQVPGNGQRSIILLESGVKPLGLAVDEVVDMVALTPEEVSPREGLPGVESRFVRGVGHHGELAFVLLDAEALIASILPS